MSFELDGDFEAAATAAARDALAERLRRRAEQVIREAIRDALVESGYQADSVLEDLVGPEVAVTGDGVRVAWVVDHPAAGFLEFGTEAHTVTGDPLAFEWADAPPEVREMFPDTFPTVFFRSVDVGGITETRHTRKALQALRRDLAR